MTELLEKELTSGIQQKLDERETLHGLLAVYKTPKFGTILTINNEIILSEQDGFFYHEMLTHPVLFTHPQPKNVAIVGAHFGILQEVLKHPNVSQITCIGPDQQLEETVAKYFTHYKSDKKDQRVSYHYSKSNDWFTQLELAAASFDVIIQTHLDKEVLPDPYHRYFDLLKADGILVQPCESFLWQLQMMKLVMQNLQQAGFHNWQTLNFPQPSYPSGWRTVMMATKHPIFKRIREKDVFNRNFTTRYYNFDTHKAALALPEFIKEELEKL